jgi:hypothetical protein
MVRDAYAAGGQPQLAEGSGSTANLTQELAQLLAQSIAQGQSGKRPPGAAATGSELASLAALVSASQNQRQPYKDGLSSLSYTRPAHSPPPAITPVLAPVPAQASSGMLIAEPQHDDEPMPIPSTWRQPMLSDDDRWYRQQLGAAALGLIAGLIVVVPAVLWLSGFLGGPQKGPRAAVAETPSGVKIAEVKRVKVDAPPKADPPAPVERTAPAPAPKPETRTASAALALPSKAAPPPPPKVESRTEELLKQARLRIESGDIKGAREILDAPETATSGAMMFMLAETYDPSMLAIWQKGGPSTADPMRARHLYQKALALGYDQAEQRLRPDWLGTN